MPRERLIHYLAEWPAWASDVVCHGDYYATVDAVIDHVIAGATYGDVETWRADPDGVFVLGSLTTAESLRSTWGNAADLADDLIAQLAVDESVDLDDIKGRLIDVLVPACAAMSSEPLWYMPSFAEVTISHRELLDMIAEEDAQKADSREQTAAPETQEEVSDV